MRPAAAYRRLRAKALSYPETYEETPWGERVVKVRKKVFVFAGQHEGGLSFTAKLPVSGSMALQLPFASPTGYGLGKSGWVTARFPQGEDVPLELLEAWLDESYRAIAPKTLLKQLSDPSGAPTAPSAPRSGARRRKGKGLVLSGDPLRAERAQRSYAAEGLTCEVSDLELPSARRKPVLVVVDLGRRPAEALDLAAELLGRKTPPRVLLCGIRDARMEKRVVAAVGDRPRSRHAPGSPQAVAQGLALLDA